MLWLSFSQGNITSALTCYLAKHYQGFSVCALPWALISTLGLSSTITSLIPVPDVILLPNLTWRVLHHVDSKVSATNCAVTNQSVVGLCTCEFTNSLWSFKLLGDLCCLFALSSVVLWAIWRLTSNVWTYRCKVLRQTCRLLQSWGYWLWTLHDAEVFM